MPSDITSNISIYIESIGKSLEGRPIGCKRITLPKAVHLGAILTIPILVIRRTRVEYQPLMPHRLLDAGVRFA